MAVSDSTALSRVPEAMLDAGPQIEEVVIHWSGAIICQYQGYEIVYLSPVTNILVAREELAAYAVSLSGGLGSAIAGERAVLRHGRSRILFWFADVLKEDSDLHRFLHHLMQRWGGRLYYFVEGRRPEQVWEKRGIIANNRMCPCSYELKVKHFRLFIQAMPHLPLVYIGYKAEETERHGRTCVSYQKAIPECIVEYPLLWEPAERRDLAMVCLMELGIVPPRVYGLGFEYNNCGSDCCRSGIGGRVLEAIYFPERYAAALKWEEAMRSKGGALTGKTFCSRQVAGKKVPLTLREILDHYVPLARAYLEAHPGLAVSEKTLLRDVRKWQREQQRRAVQLAAMPELWPSLEGEDIC